MSSGNEASGATTRKTSASARGAARLLAVQALYQLDIRGGEASEADATVQEFLEHRTEIVDEEAETKVRLEADKVLFADIVRGVSADQANISGLGARQTYLTHLMATR